MKIDKFSKHYDSSEQAHNSLYRLSEEHYVLFYGFGRDPKMGDAAYRWRKDYDHRPTMAEVKSDIEALVNALTEDKIRTGMVWNGKTVWLSAENQMNFREVSAPVRYKIGEDEEGHPVYHTFESDGEMEAFRRAVGEHIYGCLQEGWEEKDRLESVVQGLMNK